MQRLYQHMFKTITNAKENCLVIYFFSLDESSSDDHIFVVARSPT